MHRIRVLAPRQCARDGGIGPGRLTGRSGGQQQANAGRDPAAAHAACRGEAGAQGEAVAQGEAGAAVNGSPVAGSNRAAGCR